MCKKIQLLLIVCLLAGESFAENAAQAKCEGWKNSLKPTGIMSAPLSLAMNGTAKYVIVLPDHATTQEQKAADELRSWLGAITDANFAIITDAQPFKDNEISIGKTNRLAKYCADVNEKKFGDEGYGIFVKDRRIFLVGGKRRGPINAVLALLEEDFGCRWYTRNVNCMPQDPNLCMQIAQREYTPQFTLLRDPFYYVAFDPNWSLHNRTNSSYTSHVKIPLEWGSSTRIHAFGHSFDYWLSPSVYKKEHPEYFGKNQPCLSNPDVLKIVTEKVLESIKAKPEVKLMSVSQNDGGGFCTCAKCAEVDRLEKSHAGSMLRFVNAVAETVEKTNPDVRIMTFAYMYSAPMPVITKPRKNVVIFLCTDTCTWERPFVRVEYDRGPVPLSWPYWDIGRDANELNFKNFFEQWISTGNPIVIWDYSANFSNFLIPMPNMHAVAANIRYYAKNNINGVFMQGNFETNGGDRDPMRAWVIAKLLWNPYLNERELANDFIYGYYGKAAPAIVKYEDMLWDIGLELEKKPVSEMKPLSNRFDTNVEFLSAGFLASANGIFVEAEKLAENDEIRDRVRLMRASIRYVELSQIYEEVKREKQLKELLGKFSSTAEKYKITHVGEGKTFSKWAADCNAIAEK